MGTRGPKSTSELTTISPSGVVVQRRLTPPADLTAEQAEIWKAIVASNAADWFTPGSAAVLAQLCRHTVAARRIGQWLSKIEESEGALDVDLWFKLLARQESESKAIASLATRLRLTPQSRYQPRGAARAGAAVRPDRFPWETSDA